MSGLNLFLFAVLPYVAFFTFFLVTIHRYRAQTFATGPRPLPTPRFRPSFWKTRSTFGPWCRFTTGSW